MERMEGSEALLQGMVDLCGAHRVGIAHVLNRESQTLEPWAQAKVQPGTLCRGLRCSLPVTLCAADRARLS
eukprot:2550294-Rhodomonas_salina.2